MFGPPSGIRSFLASGVTDMWKSFNGLPVQVQRLLAQDPHDGAFACFCGRRRGLLRILVWDGQGPILLATCPESGKFVCPQAVSGVVSLTPAMPSVLLEGPIGGCLLNSRIEIAALKVQLAHARRQQYDRSSERLTAGIGQLEMLIGGLKENQAQSQAAAVQRAAGSVDETNFGRHVGACAEGDIVQHSQVPGH